MRAARWIVALALCVACGRGGDGPDAAVDAVMRRDDCCSNADCAWRGEEWVCDPASLRCYRPGECDASNLSLAPCQDGCALGRCACSLFLDADGCRPEETCDRVPGRPSELGCRAEQIVCATDYECPPYYRCEPYRSGARCVLGEACDVPEPQFEGCPDALLAEPGTYLLDESAAAPNASFRCGAVETGDYDFVWYRLRIPPRATLTVEVRDASLDLSWWAVVFLESCERSASCTAAERDGPQAPAYRNDGAIERIVHVAITKPVAGSFEILFELTEAGP